MLPSVSRVGAKLFRHGSVSLWLFYCVVLSTVGSAHPPSNLNERILVDVAYTLVGGVTTKHGPCSLFRAAASSRCFDK